MGAFLVRRILSFIPVLFVVTLVTFMLMKAAPGGPWDRDAEAKQVNAITLKLLEDRFGLNKPGWRQYMMYVIGDVDSEGKFKCGAVCGNLGPSYRQRGRTVQDILFSAPPNSKSWFDSKFGYTLRLGLLALFFAVAVGVPLGVISALGHNTFADYFVTFITNIGIAVPSFVVSFVAIVVFAVGFKVMKVAPNWSQGEGSWLLVAALFGFGTMSSFARLTRSSILDVMRQDYIRTARSKGAMESSVIWRHMLRNALIPVVTSLGPAFAGLLTGSIIIEQINRMPGIGADFITSIGNRDYSMIMGTTLFYVVLLLFGNLAVDILYGVVDPRIRVE
jgi:oligopeptide transport system permease protein